MKFLLTNIRAYYLIDFILMASYVSFLSTLRLAKEFSQKVKMNHGRYQRLKTYEGFHDGEKSTEN